MQAQLLQSSGKQMEHFLHEFVDKSRNEWVIKRSWLSCDPSMEIPEEFIGPKWLCLLELFDPKSNHFPDILKCFFNLTHFIKRFPFARICISFDDQSCSFPILHSQILCNGHSVDSQVFHGDFNTVIAINARIDDFSSESSWFVGSGELWIKIIPPSDLIPRV